MLTEKQDLRGGRPLWRDIAGGAVRTRTRLKVDFCDVAVVGGGVSGSLVALKLANAGLDVVVVDRRKPGSGSTAASTAMIQFELDTPLRELSDKIGARKANQAYRRSLRAVDDLRRLIVANRIRCDWRDRDALYLAGDALGSRGLKAEAAARDKIGLPSSFLAAQELRDQFGIDRSGAIFSQEAAELNPARLSAGALKAAIAKGCRVYADQEVTGVECASGVVSLTTDQGGEIRAGRVVFATGYETVKGVPKGQFDITSSWAIATKPLSPDRLWPTRCLIWEASDPYLYLRATTYHRVVAGGEDSELNDADRRDGAIPNKSAKLMASLDALLPGRGFELDYAWAGAFAVSPTGLPIIAEVDGYPGCLSILGCGGNGITFSMIAADIAVAWAGDGRDPDAALFESAGR